MSISTLERICCLKYSRTDLQVRTFNGNNLIHVGFCLFVFMIKLLPNWSLSILDLYTHNEEVTDENG